MSISLAESGTLDQLFPGFPGEPEVFVDDQPDGYGTISEMETIADDDLDSYEDINAEPLGAEERKDQVLDWFLNGSPVSEGTNSTLIRKVMSSLVGTEFLEDPKVIARFRVAQSGLTLADLSDVPDTPRPSSAREQSEESFLSSKNPHWYDRAVCADTDEAHTEVFYPRQGGSVRAGIELCNTCPVENVCLVRNMADPYGIWGGTGQRSRIRINNMLEGEAGIKKVVAEVLTERNRYPIEGLQTDEDGSLHWQLTKLRREMKEAAEKKLAEEALAASQTETEEVLTTQ